LIQNLKELDSIIAPCVRPDDFINSIGHEETKTPAIN